MGLWTQLSGPQDLPAQQGSASSWEGGALLQAAEDTGQEALTTLPRGLPFSLWSKLSLSVWKATPGHTYQPRELAPPLSNRPQGGPFGPINPQPSSKSHDTMRALAKELCSQFSLLQPCHAIHVLTYFMVA